MPLHNYKAGKDNLYKTKSIQHRKNQIKFCQRLR